MFKKMNCRFLLQGGWVRTAGEGVVAYLGHSRLLIRTRRFVRTWRAAEEIGTNGLWQYCTGPYQESDADQVVVQFASAYGTGTVDIAGLVFFELPRPDWIRD